MAAAEPTATILSVLLSGGAAVMAATLISGVRAIRRGHARAVRDNIADLSRWRTEAEGRARAAQAREDYWRNVAAHRGWQLINAGIEPYEEHPAPPSEQRRGADKRRG